MKNLSKEELILINGGGDTTPTNYVGGLSPAIPESGGHFIVGFFSGLIKSLFSI